VARDLIGKVEGPTQGTFPTNAGELEGDETTRSGAAGSASPRDPRPRNETDLPDGTYIVMINEIPLASGNVSLKRRFLAGIERRCSHALASTESPFPDPVTGDDGFWIEERTPLARVESQKPELWSLSDYMMRHVEAVVGRMSEEFLGHQEIMNLLDNDSSGSDGKNPRFVGDGDGADHRLQGPAARKSHPAV